MYIKGDSDINGKGIIATEDIPDGKLIGGFITKKRNDNYRYLKEGEWWEDGLIGRFINHSKNPNTELNFDGMTYNIISKGILEGEEILANYQWAYDITGYYNPIIDK